MILFWRICTVVALWWPARLAGALDGIPLETIPKAVILGVVLPTLLWCHPRFLLTRGARGMVVALIALKAAGTLALVPDGWCVRFEPTRPYVTDATSAAPHSWDVRADWLAPDPVCSAVMRRSYLGLGEFPAWFFNLPGAGGGWPIPEDRPPHAATRMTVTGFVDTPAGVLAIDTGPDMAATTYVDGVAIGHSAGVEAGVHRIRVDAMLTGNNWRFAPRWNDRDLWRQVTATLRRPSTIDRVVRPAGAWLITGLATLLLAGWVFSFSAQVGSVATLIWIVAASAMLAALALTGHVDAARWLVPALAGAAFVPVPARLRNVPGVFALVGIPWLALVVAVYAGDIGRFTMYTFGNDYWGFQRAAYRIVMQGYWLEGGSVTFYFQPLYRWIAGLIHLVFGDSSVGERYWDSACLLATALLAYTIVKASAGFRWGILAAVLTMSVITLSNAWVLIGLGLSEITSAGFLSWGAFAALRARRGSAAWIGGAGVLATLAFYTRLNNLPMACGVAAFALPMRASVQQLPRLIATRRIAWRVAVGVLVTIGVGMLCFAWRTWYYTGVFSVFHGTQAGVPEMFVIRPGASISSNVQRAIDSVLMVLTVNDPPRFVWQAVPVLGGAAAAVAAICWVPRLRELPAAPVLFFLGALSSALVARGSGYPGRFSVHVIAVTCALLVCTVARVLPDWRRRRL